MKILMFVSLLGIGLHGATAVKRSMTLYLMDSSGVPDVPEFVAITNLEGEIMTYYDSNIKRIEPRQDWVRKFMEDDPEYWKTHLQDCMHYQQVFKVESDGIKQQFNQTEGVHIKQQIVSCDWDDETGEVDGYNRHGYNGEDFVTFDLKTETWIAANPRAEVTKQLWDKNKAMNGHWKNFFTTTCLDMLKSYFNRGKSYLERTDLPSVSLLQKTPSSPVSCHASGFYPERSSLFWRKDGEEIHEDVEHGEILPYIDGTFQMSVDLNLSSVTPEDWRRYECVFELSGVKGDIVTKLDKAKIRTNWVEPSDMTVPITVAVAVPGLVIIIIAAIGFVCKKKKKKAPDNTSELSEKLNPET